MIDRGSRAVLVPSSHAMAGIGAIRSLGAAGYRVHAIASRADALGLKSRYAAKSVVHPPLGSAEFDEWFRGYVRKNSIDLVMPGLSLNESVRHDYSRLLTTSDEPGVRAAARSKVGLFEKLQEGSDIHRAHLPPYLLIDFRDGIPSEAALAALGLPLFIKLDGTEARNLGHDEVLKIASARDARATLEELRSRYHRVLVQGYVPGRGTGVFLLRWEGRIIARMMHRRLHEMPHTGGASSLRVSWWHDEMMRDAEMKLAHLDWRGVAMVEYRWDDRRNEFYLMEMNLRLWGSLHLALFAGVDFPRLLADAFFGKLPDGVVEGRIGVVCRNTIPFEVGYLVSLWRDPSVSWLRKFYSIMEAVSLTLDPRVHNDLWYEGDRMLFFYQLYHFLVYDVMSIRKSRSK